MTTTRLSKEKYAPDVLSDEDRWPWLRRLREEIHSNCGRSNVTVVVACSALKIEYRRYLSGSGSDYHARWFIFEPDENVIIKRLKDRKGHYMGPQMSASQLATLEPPIDAEEWLPIESSIPTLPTRCRPSVVGQLCWILSSARSRKPNERLLAPIVGGEIVSGS